MQTIDEIIEMLAECACEGRLIFFIGAGFSKAVVGKYDSGPVKGQDRALSWIDLLRKVAAQFKIEKTVPSTVPCNSLDCPQIASEMIKALHQNNIGRALTDCERQIRECVCKLTDWYPNKDQKIGWAEIFDAIRPAAIITTNYDHVLEELLEDDAISFSSTDTLPTSFDEKYLIYHIHGVRNRPDDLVLTRQDYVEALRPFSYRQVRLATLLRENSVLYLGYAKNDINILSALDTAKEAFSDIKKDCVNLHIQILYDDTGSMTQVIKESEDEIIKSYSIKVADIKTFLNKLSLICDNKREQIRNEYNKLIQTLNSLTKQGEIPTKQNEAIQRHSDIVNVFENSVKLLNSPTKLGRLFAPEFDCAIKKYYRELYRQAHERGNWERYADMWAVLYAYFLMLSPKYAPKPGEGFSKPIPYTRRFKYAIGWFNGLALFIGSETGKSRMAWDWFRADWPILSLETRKIIADSAIRNGYKNIIDLLRRAEFNNDICNDE